MLRRLRNVRSDERGSALLEGALIFPFLFTLVFGVYEFSSIFYQHHLITNGIRDAARYVARLNNPDAGLVAAQKLATTGKIDGTTRRLSWWAPESVTMDFDDFPNLPDEDGVREYRGGDEIRVVIISTDVTFPNLGFLELLGIDPITMTVSHQERVIGE